MTTKQKYTLAITITVILLIAFLFYYFRNRKKGEKCPDGRGIPLSGNCADNAQLFDENGNAIVTPSNTDINGCVQPTSYIVNYFPLTLGMKGDLVKQVQTVLGITTDGYFGCKTLDAVIKKSNVREIDAERFKNVYTENPNI